MVGRRIRRWRDDDPDTHGPQPEALLVCPLCERPIPRHARQSVHHLTPKLKGGARGATVRLHQICHSAIHARYSEAEIARFLEWVRDKPDDFHAPTRQTRERRGEGRARR